MMIQHIPVLLSLIVNITKHIVGQLQQQDVMVEYAMAMLYPKLRDGIVTGNGTLPRPTLGSFVVATMTMARVQECSTSTSSTALLTAAFRSVSFSSLRALALLL